MFYLCDMPMGSGKSSAAITMMNENPDKKFIYVTPNLSETIRIADSCPKLKFKLPDDEVYGSKRNHLHQLLQKNENISMTHKLFLLHNSETISLVKDKGYTLVMDEALGVVSSKKINNGDVDLLLDSKYVDIGEDKSITWLGAEYEEDGVFADIKDACETGRAHISKGRGKQNAILNIMPKEIFYEFEDVYVFTYMFDGEVMKNYFNLYGFVTNKIGVSKVDGVYRFSDCFDIPDFFGEIKSMVHVFDDEKMLSLEKHKKNFSKGWYERKQNEKDVDQLRKHSGNYIMNRFRYKDEFGKPHNIKKKDVMWTCWDKYKEPFMKDNGKDGYVACNTRATNEHRNRTHLVYLINMYYNTGVKNFFAAQGVTVNNDQFALSMMLQWIWRSAIRDGNEIWIYIPSSRMRNLLINWMDEQEAIVAEQRKRKEAA